MKIIHSAGRKRIEKNVKDEASFMLANRKGGYCWLYDEPKSKYNGVFFFKNNCMLKVIEDIRINDSKRLSAIKNNFWNAERKRGELAESFFMPFYYDSIVYELNKEAAVELILDVRESFSFPELGRSYEIFGENEKIIIKYSYGGQQFYLAIDNEKNSEYEKISKWDKKFYEHDKKRSSSPFEMYAFSALRIKTDRLILTFSGSKDEAVRENNFIKNNLEKLKNKQEKYYEKMLNEKIFKKIKNHEIFFAYLSAVNSLESLTASVNNKTGLLAGLPWFFQLWPRDELICVKALNLTKNYALAREIIKRTIEHIDEEGKMPNNYSTAGLKSADAVGLLFKRISEDIHERRNYRFIEENLSKSINLLLQSSTMEGTEGFALNNELETWMDTDYAGDRRAGARIEMQALRLEMYRFMRFLTNNIRYFFLEKHLRDGVRQKFFDGKTLADGIDDFTVRPNIFIAAYVYPELLIKTDWIKCFDSSLPKLWLGWGGLATIEKSSPLFTDEYTGEDNKSYHRGDSWFWINNLSAVVLNKTDKKKFQKYIKKILSASTTEILWKGAIGCHAELSSAKELRSEGCLNQAWSNAMYIEMVNEVFS